jgi:hypothetical protein
VQNQTYSLNTKEGYYDTDSYTYRHNPARVAGWERFDHRRDYQGVGTIIGHWDSRGGGHCIGNSFCF